MLLKVLALALVFIGLPGCVSPGNKPEPNFVPGDSIPAVGPSLPMTIQIWEWRGFQPEPVDVQVTPVSDLARHTKSGSTAAFHMDAQGAGQPEKRELVFSAKTDPTCTHETVGIEVVALEEGHLVDSFTQAGFTCGEGQVVVVQTTGSETDNDSSGLQLVAHGYDPQKCSARGERLRCTA